MPIRTDLNTQELIAQFRAQRDAAQRRTEAPSSKPKPGASSGVQSSVKLEATIRASKSADTDQVDIQLAGSLTVEAANGILEDSVVEEINKAFQEAGIDLTVEDIRSEGSVSPEATANRIVGFATGFLDAYNENHAADAPRARIQGFMSVIRQAITNGFQQARDFLSGIEKLSETVDENISKTFEITNALLDRFHETQLAGLETDDQAEAVEAAETADPDSEAPDVPRDTDGNGGTAPLTEGLV